MQPKVSVCIPVYNVAGFLASCLNSVVSQTLPDLEIICVEDASTDNSGDILKLSFTSVFPYTTVNQNITGDPDYDNNENTWHSVNFSKK